MKNFKKLWFGALLGIIILGILLRFHNLSVWPRTGATFDEYAWTWQGISLIQKQVPTSWSYHPQYKEKKLIKYQTVPFILVTPYLEHPPLFGLVAGGYALISGANGMFDITIEKIRGLALIMGGASILLVFLLSEKLFGRSVGLLSALFYATIPTVVIGSRLVQNENFFIPVWILSLYLISIYIKRGKKWIRNTAVILAGILILAKIPWIAASFSLCIIFLYNKRYKDVLLTIAVGVFMLAVYFAYGFYFNKEIFLSLWGLQLNRYDITFASIYALFQKPYLADRHFLDGWIFFGWIAFILAAAKDFKKQLILISAILSYFLIFIVGIPDEAGHGWYRYPFYPFLAISLALFVKEYFNKNYILTFLFIVLVGTSLFETTWKNAFGFSYVVFRVILISWGVVLIPQYLPSNATIKLSRITGYFWFTAFIIMNIWAVMIYNEQ